MRKEITLRLKTYNFMTGMNVEFVYKGMYIIYIVVYATKVVPLEEMKQNLYLNVLVMKGATKFDTQTKNTSTSIKCERHCIRQ